MDQAAEAGRAQAGGRGFAEREADPAGVADTLAIADSAAEPRQVAVARGRGGSRAKARAAQAALRDRRQCRDHTRAHRRGLDEVTEASSFETPSCGGLLGTRV